MKGGRRLDVLWVAQQCLAALQLRLFQLLKGVKVAIGDAFVGQGPESLTWLQLWRIRRQKDEMEPFWDDQLRTAMPACSIQHQDNMLARTGTDTACKLLQGQIHHGNIDPRKEQPDGSPRLRMHKAIDVHPLVARLHDHPRTHALLHPDATQQGFETDAMLIKGPEFDACLGMLPLDLGSLAGKFF